MTRWVPKMHDLFNNGLKEEETDSVDTEIDIFLSPGGVTEDTEVLNYDGYDLVGNVGGFLGLFLGASFLSLYDLTVARMGWIRKKIRRRKVDKVKEERTRAQILKRTKI